MTFRSALPLLSGTAVLLCVIPSRTVAAQSLLRHHHVRALGAAIEEARGSPFHRQTGARATVSLHLLGHREAYRPQEIPESPTDDSTPSFARVFVSTLAMTYLADLVGLWAALCWAYGGGGGCIDNETINLALGVTVPVVVPALTAGGITDRMLPGFVGSALGTMAAWMSLRAIDPESGQVFIVPAIDAALTTLVTLAFPDLGN